MLFQEKLLFSRENEQLWPILDRIKARIDEASYGRHLLLSTKISLLPIKAVRIMSAKMNYMNI